MYLLDSTEIAWRSVRRDRGYTCLINSWGILSSEEEDLPSPRLRRGERGRPGTERIGTNLCIKKAPAGNGRGIFFNQGCDNYVIFRVYNNTAKTKGAGDNCMTHRILVVEDEADIAELIRLHLADLDFDVTVASDGHQGLRLATMQTWDLVILDLRLPGVDGLEICRSVRKGSSYVPILMLTSKSSELDRVLGLEMGADDYVTKPFSVLELTARVKAILRRAQSLAKPDEESAEVLEIGSLRIDPAMRSASVEGEQVELTAREFDLLLHFARNPGRVYRRAELLDRVWGYGHDGYEHTVNSHINRLRSKIEANSAEPEYIVTVWGVGYKLHSPGSPLQSA